MYARDYRARARQALTGNWLLSTLVAFIAGVLGGALHSNSNSGMNIELDEETLDLFQISSIPYELERILTIALMILVPLAIVTALVTFILGGTIRLGHCQYLLDQQDGRPLNVGTLFSHFKQFGNGFCLALLTSIFTFLWSLLLIIPGIIASYRYAMAPFIQAEHPEYTASESINASKQMMDGHKWELFCLDFSFIGWSLLCIFTLGIGNLFLSAYTSAAHAAFYRELCPECFDTTPAEPETPNPDATPAEPETPALITENPWNNIEE